MSKWKPIKTAPKNGTPVDLWLQVYASPRSFGMADALRVTDAFLEGDCWFHYYNGKKTELCADYITHWMPIPAGPGVKDEIKKEENAA